MIIQESWAATLPHALRGSTLPQICLVLQLVMIMPIVDLHRAVELPTAIRGPGRGCKYRYVGILLVVCYSVHIMNINVYT